MYLRIKGTSETGLSRKDEPDRRSDEGGDILYSEKLIIYVEPYLSGVIILNMKLKTWYNVLVMQCKARPNMAGRGWAGLAMSGLAWLGLGWACLNCGELI